VRFQPEALTYVERKLKHSKGFVFLLVDRRDVDAEFEVRLVRVSNAHLHLV
jgi:hypothetical protein